ncbi:MAG TPA: hypothetical protein VI564_00145 [Candidatus Nanoarchaeia archaeon]|nr:hypothetical protein [Candidatus Nanoarchaeia archaeon]
MITASENLNTYKGFTAVMPGTSVFSLDQIVVSSDIKNSAGAVIKREDVKIPQRYYGEESITLIDYFRFQELIQYGIEFMIENEVLPGDFKIKGPFVVNGGPKDGKIQYFELQGTGNIKVDLASTEGFPTSNVKDFIVILSYKNLTLGIKGSHYEYEEKKLFSQQPYVQWHDSSQDLTQNQHLTSIPSGFVIGQRLLKELY